jgi:xylulokinase
MVEGAAYGAAILTGVGAGVWLDVVDVCKKVVRLAEITKPNEEQVVIYRITYPIYRELYPSLKSSFQKMN